MKKIFAFALVSPEARRILLLSLIVAVFASAALGIARTKLPFCDEGWLASPGLNLLRHGSMETSVLEPAGSWLKGIDRYTYWVMPLWILFSALWYKLFGFGLITLRSVSLLWGALGVIACYVLAKQLTGSRGLGVLAAALFALDSNTIINGGTGRMDMMSAMCGLCGLAAYMLLRERSITRAIIVSNALLAVAIFSHPNAIISFVSLVFLAIYFDGDRITPGDVFLAAVPYSLAALGWGLYISRDWASFLAQFSGNVSHGGRGQLLHHPLQALLVETRRYRDGYSLNGISVKALRGVSLLLYLIAFCAAWAIREIRDDRRFRAALILMPLSAGVLFAIDGIKRAFYLVHVLPFFAICAAIWLTWLWRRQPRLRIATAAGVTLASAIQQAGVVRLIHDNAFDKAYVPVIAYFNQHRQPNTVIMGPSELGFGLGYAYPLIDDYRLGYYSRKRPAYIVENSNFRSQMNSLQQEEPKVFAAVEDVLQNSTVVYRNAYYTVYRSGNCAPTSYLQAGP